MTPPYAGTLVGSGSACHLAISERFFCQQKHTKNPKVGGEKAMGPGWLFEVVYLEDHPDFKVNLMVHRILKLYGFFLGNPKVSSIRGPE